MTSWRRVGECRYSSILDLDARWRWVVSFTLQPLLLPRKYSRCPFYKRLGGPHSRSGPCGIEIFHPWPYIKYSVICISMALNCNATVIESSFIIIRDLRFSVTSVRNIFYAMWREVIKSEYTDVLDELAVGCLHVMLLYLEDRGSTFIRNVIEFL
jgi:hypothetical protein